ncbi:allophanate hydrolase subunit 1 [Trinickia terrae]|uniref:Allophanate hydrolase subunit 1 n=1 Tax=Trinickia terrae TaxID=2571161 RepID=A0A4U1IGB3_9BURK|nr:allophanate hydrolase subunit 1 [Trinickia terrae]TKC92615.1 allophanate hydrolase subunit 1 [Trinickia terrae]
MLPGAVEIVPALTTLGVHYRPYDLTPEGEPVFATLVDALAGMLAGGAALSLLVLLRVKETAKSGLE